MGLRSFITPVFLSLLSPQIKQRPPRYPSQSHPAHNPAKEHHEEIIWLLKMLRPVAYFNFP